MSRRSRLTTLVAKTCGAVKNPHTIRKEWGTEFPVLWSGLYPSQKHLAWLLCSGIIHDRLAAARGAFTCIWSIPLGCDLGNSAFGLQVRVISRHTLAIKENQSDDCPDLKGYCLLFRDINKL